MDAKITKKRLAHLLSYDWVKIIALAVGVIILWSLVFNMTATRITPAQQFSVMNYYCNNSFSNAFHNIYDSALDGKDKVFSYEVIEGTTNDLVSAGDEWGTLLQARASIEEGDVIFVPDIADVDSEYTTNPETNEPIYTYTYVESFLRGYVGMIYELSGEDGYFSRLETLLNGYYHGDYANGELDTQKVEKDFCDRVERNKDKRFKKEEEIERGVQDEIARIKKYRDAYIEFNAYLSEGIIEFNRVKIVWGDGEYDYIEGDYGLNLCPDERKMNKLKNYLSYTTVSLDEKGNQKDRTITAKDMNVLFFNFDGVESSFEYESLLFVNKLISLSRSEE